MIASNVKEMNGNKIIGLLIVASLIAGGCANKKHLTRAEKAAIEAAERQRVQDSIAQAEALRLQEIERQRVLDSIAAAEAEAARKARESTLYVSRMTVTVSMHGQQISTPATLRWKRGEGAVASVQPFAGIEMLRVELDNQGLTLIDKINRRYARLTADELAEMGAPTTLDEVDNWVDEHILARRNEPQLTLQVTRADISGTASFYTSAMQVGSNFTLRPTNVSTYKQVTLEQLASGF